jgi:hypothetical protein
MIPNITNKRYTRDQLGPVLRAVGYPISDATLDKLCSPAVGQGPPVAGWWGRRPLYELDTAITWAELRLSHIPPPRLPPRTRRKRAPAREDGKPRRGRPPMPAAEPAE